MGYPNPWLPGQPDPRLQPPPGLYGPVDQGQVSPWDAPRPLMPPSPSALANGELAGLHVPGVMRGSGEKQSENVSDRETHSTTEHAGTWDMEQVLRNAGLEMAIPQIAAQQRSQDENRALFRMELARPRTPDLAGPLSLAAHAIDPKYAVIPPSQPTGVPEKEIREWAKQQQDDQRDLSRVIIQGSNAAKSGFFVDQNGQIHLAGAMQSQGNFPNPNVDVGNFDKWTQRADTRMKSDLDAAREAEHLRYAINGSPIAQREIPIIITRMLTGGSRQPVQEVAMAKDPGLWQGLEQRYKSAFHDSSDPAYWDSLTPDIKNEYKHFAADLLSVHDQGLQIRRQQSLSDAQDYHVPMDRAQQHLLPYFVNPYTPQAAKSAGVRSGAPPTTAAPDGGGDPGMDAFLRARGH